jgi:uncharacterized protein
MMLHGLIPAAAIDARPCNRPYNHLIVTADTFPSMTNASLLARNVFNEPIVPCSFSPVTGFFRDGCCKTTEDDVGMHTVCAVMTEEFLRFSLERGNDLMTPRPEWGFPGLKPGDQWCLCAARWHEAYLAHVAPPVVLESTNFSVLDDIPLEVLQQFSRDSL